VLDLVIHLHGHGNDRVTHQVHDLIDTVPGPDQVRAIQAPARLSGAWPWQLPVAQMYPARAFWASGT